MDGFWASSEKPAIPAIAAIAAAAATPRDWRRLEKNWVAGPVLWNHQLFAPRQGTFRPGKRSSGLGLGPLGLFGVRTAQKWRGTSAKMSNTSWKRRSEGFNAPCWIQTQLIMYVSWFYSHVFEDLSVKRTTKTLNINEPQPDFQKDYDYGRCVLGTCVTRLRSWKVIVV